MYKDTAIQNFMSSPPGSFDEGFFHSQYADVAKHIPSVQLLPGARAPIVIVPHRSSDNKALCLFIPQYLKLLLLRKYFPSLRKRIVRQRTERCQKHLQLLCFIENKLFFVITKLVVNKFIKCTGEPAQSVACCRQSIISQIQTYIQHFQFRVIFMEDSNSSQVTESTDQVPLPSFFLLPLLHMPAHSPVYPPSLKAGLHTAQLTQPTSTADNGLFVV